MNVIPSRLLKLTVAKKLGVILAVAILAMLLQFVHTISTNNTVKEQLTIADQRMSDLNELFTLKQASTELTLTAMDMIIDVNGSIERRKELAKELPVNTEILTKMETKIVDIADTDEEKKLATEIVQNIEILITSVNNGLVPIILSHNPDDSTEVAEVYNKMDAFDDAIDGSADVLSAKLAIYISSLDEESHEADEALISEVNDASKSSKWVFIISIIVLISITLIMIKSILGSIKRAVAATDDIIEKIVNQEEDISCTTDDIAPDFIPVIEGLNQITDQIHWYISLLDNTPVAISVIDNDSNWSFVNKKVEEMVGKKRGELLNKQCSLWGTDNCNNENCPVERIKEGHSITEVTIPNDTNVYRALGTELFDKSGSKIGFMEAVMDITDIQKATDAANKVQEFLSHEITVLSEVLQKLSEGNFLSSYHLSEVDDDTESSVEVFSLVENALNSMISELRAVITSVIDTTTNLNQSAISLTTDSKKLSENFNSIESLSSETLQNSGEMSGMMNSIAAAIEEMSVNTSTISAASEEMSVNMKTVTESINRMIDSIGELSKDSSEAQEVSTSALDFSNNAKVVMGSLGDAALDIGKVTEVIMRIAEQTNLLALNATIEAASAGEAGKGFAVVANEIKELATQSAKAAEEISQKIKNIQDNSKSAVDVISSVSDKVEEISSSITKVNSAAEAQNIMSTEIYNNINETFTAVENITQNIAEMSTGANEIATNVASSVGVVENVNRSMQKLSDAVSSSAKSTINVDNSAQELSKMANDLSDRVGKFLV